jgi:hypothetical protein
MLACFLAVHLSPSRSRNHVSMVILCGASPAVIAIGFIHSPPVRQVSSEAFSRPRQL